MVVLEKENCLREYKYWSYEKDQNYLVFNVVRYIEFFNVWMNSCRTKIINSPLTICLILKETINHEKF
jgi:hypothetical protein